MSGSLTYEHRTVTADDGAPLAVHLLGRGTPLLFATGIGVRCEGLEPLTRQLQDRYRILFWDYRAMGESPFDGRVPDMSVLRHARDGLAVLDALGIEQAPVAGWSMGVPVSLEMFRRAPSRVSALAALFGSPGEPFMRGFPSPVARTMEGFFGLLRRFPGPSQAAFDLAVALPDVAFALMSGVSFVGRNAPRGAFDRQVAGVAATPKGPYFQAMLEMARHSAWDLLPRVTCPTLVVGGGRDWLTPPSTARAMAAAIPGARLHLFPQATHFGLVEEADAVARLVGGFLATRTEAGACSG
jgi:3-oxoadipate enol-lactonase